MALELKKLIDERLKLIADMRGMLNAAPDGLLAEDKQGEYDRMETREGELEESISRANRLIESERSLEAPTSKKLATAEAKPGTDNRAADLHMKCFRSYLTNGASAFQSQEFMELRSLNAGIVTEGGAFIPPQEFVNQLIQAVTDQVFIRSMSSVFVVSKAASLGFPTLTTRLNNLDWSTELTNPSADTSMRTGLREFKPTPFAKLVKISRKLMAHSVISVEQMVLNDIARAVGETEEAAYLTGSGAGRPLGVMTPSDQGIPTSRDTTEDMTDTDFTADALINAESMLKGQYAVKAKWMFHRLGIKRIRKLKDGEGQYLWQPGLISGQPDTLLTHPVVKSEFFPSTFTTGQYVGIIGDFSKYYIADDAGEVALQRLIETFALTNEDGFLVRKAGDGMPVLGEAFVRIKTT